VYYDYCGEEHGAFYNYILDVAKFITLTPLSLQISCEL
jgi:hypothetical protein